MTSAVFRAVFGAESEGTYAAPGRVNLIGEYTDLNESLVLPFATPQRTTVALRRRAGRVLRLASPAFSNGLVEYDLDASRPPLGWSAYPVAVVRAIEEAGFTLGGADILIRSDVPAGAGLSSSAALECGVGLALCDLFDVPLRGLDLARVCQRAENRFVGVPCGLMDQAASLCCAAGRAMLFDTRTLAQRQVALPLEGGELVVVLIDTRVKHNLLEDGYATRAAQCQSAARVLGVAALRDAAERDLDLGGLDEILQRRARHVVSEHRRVLAVVAALEAGRLADLGELLNASHASLRDDLAVSCAELDLAAAAAREAGALGARMVGAGFGGSVLALVAREQVPTLAALVSRRFAEMQLAEPTYTPVVPAAGAQRIA